ncbi:hypothetical protein [Marinobacter salicampi]|uniref:hypothetical protein n=1 Tax=Marinobacter salicampi TaxID=435907 RepID=UPI001408041D|nr:hypothetical protein [Marinobacter salicampi]
MKVPMKFPYVTVVLVLLALIYVLWDQTRPSADLDPQRFTDLEANPASASDVLAFFSRQTEGMCYEKTASSSTGTDDLERCIDQAEKREARCLRAVGEGMPEVIRSEQAFRRYGLELMDCMVPMQGVTGSE